MCDRVRLICECGQIGNKRREGLLSDRCRRCMCCLLCGRLLCQTGDCVCHLLETLQLCVFIFLRRKCRKRDGCRRCIVLRQSLLRRSLLRCRRLFIEIEMLNGRQLRLRRQDGLRDLRNGVDGCSACPENLVGIAEKLRCIAERLRTLCPELIECLTDSLNQIL